MRRRYRATTIAGALLCGARFAHGQTTTSIDIGLARLNQSGLAASGVATLGVETAIHGPHGALTFSALGAQGSGGLGTGQATASASWLTPAFQHSTIEWSVTGTAFGATDQLPVTSLELSANHYLSTTHGFGLFYGVGGGLSAWAAASLPVAGGEVGSWWHHGADQLSMVTDLTLTQSEFRTRTAAGEERTVFDVRYADAAINWRRSLDRATLAASGGVRLGIDHVTARSAWGEATAMYALVSHLSLVAGVGRTPPDYVRGVPESRYLSLSARVGSAADHRGRSRGRSAGGPNVSIDGSGEHHIIRVRAAGASQVEVMGDFTEWQSIAMSADQGEWTLDRPMSPGPHRLLIRVDGGAWVVPANLPRGRDDFGNDVGLITVL